MRPIRASEIGAFLYCRRAWWYQSQGMKSENQADLAGGNAFHQQHGRQVMVVNFLRLAGGLLLALALILLVVSLTLQALK
jgi:Flp pilus assembly protein TadB